MFTKFKSYCKWQLMYIKNSTLIFFVAFLFLGVALIVIANMIAGETVMDITGMDTSALIFVGITGITFFSDSVKFALANGVSRKTMFASQLAVSAIISFVMALFSMIIYKIFELIANGVFLGSIEPVTGTLYSSNTFTGLLGMFIFQFSIGIMLYLLGLLIGSFYYRADKATRIIVSVGIPALLFVVLPIILTYYPTLSNAAAKLIGSVLTFVSSGIFNILILSVIGSTIIAGIAYLFIRKVPMKTQ